MQLNFSAFRNSEIINPILSFRHGGRLKKFWMTRQMHVVAGLKKVAAIRQKMRCIIKLISWWLLQSKSCKRSACAHIYSCASKVITRICFSSFFFFPSFHSCFHIEEFITAERIAQPTDTTYTINTSERHKSGLGMCHGNHFFFFCCAESKRTPSIMFAHMNVCLWGTMIHRAPHLVRRTVSRLTEKTSAEKERFGKCLRSFESP